MSGHSGKEKRASVLFCLEVGLLCKLVQSELLVASSFHPQRRRCGDRTRPAGRGRAHGRDGHGRTRGNLKPLHQIQKQVLMF